MKVTVCFGDVKVIVPCGEGDLSVRELIERAVSRYRKASYKNALDNISVRWLETIEDNAILDADDRVADVCDDKDKLIAIFDEKVKKRPSNNGDGTSASSVGTSSPDMFTGHTNDEGERFRSIDPYQSERESNNNDDDLLVTEKQKYANGVKLVNNNIFFENNRTQDGERSSELKRELFIEQQNRDRPSQLGRLGWGHRKAEFTQNVNRRSQENSGINNVSSSNSPASSPDEPSREFSQGFHRTVNRKSLSAGHPMLYSWIDAQEKMFGDKYMERPTVNREEPAGSSLSSPRTAGRRTPTHEDNEKAESFQTSGSESEEVELDPQDIQNLGLQVRGYKTADGRELGLIVVGVSKQKLTTRESLQVADRITEVNGVDIRGRSNSEAEGLFMDALKSELVKLKRTRSHRFVTDSSFQKASGRKPNVNKLPEDVVAVTKEAPRPVVKTVAEGDHQEKAIEAPAISEKENSSAIQKANKILIQLTKGKDGLGFSITSRDVLTSGTSRIFVKNILNRGSAIADGRLQTGDELIEVNGSTIAGKQQSEVTQMLRSAQGIVSLVVQRLPTENEQVETTSEIPVVKDTPEADGQSEVLSLTIPLTTLGSAGLGISVKSKTSDKDVGEKDLGIFVKTVLKGGAAAKDGRLQQDDQLLCLDDSSLIGLSNSHAMETLRIVMQNAIKKGSIKIIVSRKSQKSLSRTSSRKDSAQLNKLEEKNKSEDDQSEPPMEVLTESHFDNTYLKRLAPPQKRSPVRNQSYFKAIDRTVASVDGVHQIPQVIQVIRKPPADQKETAPRAVSVNSVELPAPQPTKSIYIAKRGVLLDSKVSRTEVSTSKAVNTPLMETKPTNGIFSSANSSACRRLSLSSENKSDRPEQNIVTKTIGQPSFSSPSETGDLNRPASVCSQLSIDSLMIGPSDMPFSRDAFGRLSMSERKGRAHLDATKSDFYSKLKKFRSMEDISNVRCDENLSPTSPTFPGLSGYGEGMRRSESADTILSRTHDEPEEPRLNSFSRNVLFNTKSTMVGPRATSPPSTKTSVKLRSRSTAWNDSFRSAVDKTPVFYSQSEPTKPDGKSDAVPITWTSNAHYLTEKQRKKSGGFLKGLGNIFKINKGKKNPPTCPETLTLGRKEKLKSGEKEEALLDFPGTPKRPKSLHEEVLKDFTSETIAQREEFAAKLHQREKKLVELERELSGTDKRPVYFPPTKKEQQKKKGAGIVQGVADTGQPGIAIQSRNRQPIQTNYGTTSEKSLQPDSLGKKEHGHLRRSRSDQHSKQSSQRRPRETSLTKTRPDVVSNRGLDLERLSHRPRTELKQTDKDKVMKPLHKSRLDNRHVSLPRQLVVKKGDQNANLRTSSETEADHVRKMGLEWHLKNTDHTGTRTNPKPKDNIVIADIPDNKGITISHTAKV